MTLSQHTTLQRIAKQHNANIALVYEAYNNMLDANFEQDIYDIIKENDLEDTDNA